jgi:type III pantothenate kinase
LRADGTFTGGLIAPGWSLMMRSLGEHTAQLPTLGENNLYDPYTPLADGEKAQAMPHELIAATVATNTRDAIAAGCALAQAAFAERMWRSLQEEWRSPVRLLVGGGAAGQVTGTLNVPYTRHDALVLSGLALIAAESTAAHRT